MATRKVYFYNSKNGDRKYDANSMIDWLLPFFTTGVFNNCFHVAAKGGMKIGIEGGHCNIKGRVMRQDGEELFDVSTASGNLTRIDNVIIRRDDTSRDIYPMIQEGVFSSTPVPPALVREGGIYDIKIAQYIVRPGAIAITQADITDTRMDVNVCGWVMSTVKEIDISQIAAQFTSALSMFMQSSQNDFNEWFEGAKDTLGEDTAGQLYNMIQSLTYEDVGALPAPTGPTPGPVTNVDTSWSQYTEMMVSWSDPNSPNWSKTILVRKATSPSTTSFSHPQTPDDGIVIVEERIANTHNSTSKAIWDRGLTPGVTYHYSLFTLNSTGNWNPDEVVRFSYKAVSGADSIWIGTWTSGQTITIPNLSAYHVFEIEFSGVGTRALAFLVPATDGGYWLRGMGGYTTADYGTTYQLGANVAANGTSATLVAAHVIRHLPNSGHNDYASGSGLTIVSIKALL